MFVKLNNCSGRRIIWWALWMAQQTKTNKNAWKFNFFNK